MKDKIREMLLDSASTKQKIAESMPGDVENFANMIVECFRRGNKLMVCGNGGSAADAQHFASEFSARYKMERRGLPAIALTTDTSVITCWVNDYDFQTLYSRQVEALGKEGDVLVGISTSGNSPNIIEAIKKAKDMKIKTIALLGKNGGKTKGMADTEIIVPSSDTPRIQEAQMCIMHIVCDLTEKELFGKENLV